MLAAPLDATTPGAELGGWRFAGRRRPAAPEGFGDEDLARREAL
jgi:hypothetical protein